MGTAMLAEKLRAAVLLIGFPFKVDRWRTSAGLALIVFAQLAGVGVAVAFKMVTDGAVDGRTSQTVAGVCLLTASMILMFGGSWGGFVVQSGVVDRTALAVDTELSHLSASMVGIEHLERPEYLDRLEYLRQYRNSLIGLPSSLARVFAVGVRLALTLVLLARVQPVLALLPLFGVPSMAATWWRNKSLSQLWDEKNGMRTRLQGVIRRLGGTDAGGREIRIFGIQEEVQRRYDKLLEENDRDWRRVSIRGALWQASTWAFFGVAFTGALVLLGRRATGGHLTPGDLVLAVTLAIQINGHVATLAGNITGVGGSLRTAERLVWLMDRAAGQSAVAGHGPVPDALVEGIRLRNVSFRYSDTADWVLTGVDLDLPAGATVALVGENGAGKTTLVKLLLRMYEPTEGSIFLDDRVLRDLDVDQWRRRTSGGFQDFARFEFSAQRTIGVGDLPAVDDESAALGALERAHGTDVLEALPDQLASPLARH